jgi:hypothetical protein
MVSATRNNEPSTLPLADYFFIAGIESSQIFDEKLQNGLTTPPVEDTIEEHTVLDTTVNGRPKSSEGLNGDGRRSRLSYEARKSISSMLGSNSGTASNRSSATIRAIPGESRGFQLSDQGGPVAPVSSAMNDEDFDSALRKFASERDTFVEEIHFSAGTIPQPSKPKARPKTQKIINEDAGGIRSGVGSIRRRISTMNSLKRQPSVMRQYNPCMPFE